jgi:hypothetical protein
MESTASLMLNLTATPSSSTNLQAQLDNKLNDFRLSMIVINALMAFFTISLNLVIILSFVKTTSLRETTSNLLLLGLALSDFCVGLFSQPIFCLETDWRTKEKCDSE